MDHKDQLVLSLDEKFVTQLPPLTLNRRCCGFVGFTADAEVQDEMLEGAEEGFGHTVVGALLGLRAGGDAELDLLDYLKILSCSEGEDV